MKRLEEHFHQLSTKFTETLSKIKQFCEEDELTIEEYFESKFYATGSIINEPGMDRFNQPGWVNKVWQSSIYRRAHIDVVDARETKGLWMMHCCIFPYTHNPAPIFGSATRSPLAILFNVLMLTRIAS